MIKVRLSEKPRAVTLCCSIRIDPRILKKMVLNCATTNQFGGQSEITDTDAKRQLEYELKEIMDNTTIEDINFSYLEDPDSYYLEGTGGGNRSANDAFFTMLADYNERAEEVGVDPIHIEDIVDLLKHIPHMNRRQLAKPPRHKITKEGTPGRQHGLDDKIIYEYKIPMRYLLKGRSSLGIFGKTSKDRLNEVNDLYVKLTVEPTTRVGTDPKTGKPVDIVDERITPISFHRDADSANTRVNPGNSDPHDTSWDREEGLTPGDLRTKASKFLDEELKRARNKKK